jgi:hypothetical protein
MSCNHKKRNRANPHPASSTSRDCIAGIGIHLASAIDEDIRGKIPLWQTAAQARSDFSGNPPLLEKLYVVVTPVKEIPTFFNSDSISEAISFSSFFSSPGKYPV